MAEPAFDPVALLARMGHAPRRITSDSRQVGSGDAFAAWPGTRVDGRAFIPDALARGAGSVLWESRGFRWDAAWLVPNAGIERLAAKLGYVANVVYGNPSRDLWMVGVTGTNGKTTTSQWIAQALDDAGRRCGVIGTLGIGLHGHLEPAPNTTPDAAVFHETLARFRDAGAKAVAMEVSSIGLDQGRVNGATFDVAVFTNLTRDHLDYHGTMADYGAAKSRLFSWPGLACSVINADDPYGQRLIDEVRGRGGRALSYGLANAEVAATGVAMGPRGYSLDVSTPWGRGSVETAVVGAFNLSNLLATLGALLASDVELDAALEALARLRPPPGRMERHGGDGRPLVVVDYAHTPDALEKVLAALRPIVAPGRELVCVFGCGGDRDAGKRALMGRIAGESADRVIVTSDNPRFEDPAAIANEVARGVVESGQRRWRIELDRAAAIQAAVQAAKVGDVVLVAGKGHEAYQEVAGERLPYTDARATSDALAAWSGA
ncbi:MAG TPA: UDP-N-acetylmuramoyl-L-alanyl-D-glutamate--2,6-diaminopimelate ligase [Casimicrobiaceae bacterium]|nr:UDP-N-acetylmuramoyl-L-alanyl-D-glutamate--2,6-diaminopimelate ligase [Casimicrobiaceae bacterium]